MSANAVRKRLASSHLAFRDAVLRMVERPPPRTFFSRGLATQPATVTQGNSLQQLIAATFTRRILPSKASESIDPNLLSLAFRPPLPPPKLTPADQQQFLIEDAYRAVTVLREHGSILRAMSMLSGARHRGITIQQDQRLIALYSELIERIARQRGPDASSSSQQGQLSWQPLLPEGVSLGTLRSDQITLLAACEVFDCFSSLAWEEASLRPRAIASMLQLLTGHLEGNSLAEAVAMVLQHMKGNDHKAVKEAVSALGKARRPMQAAELLAATFNGEEMIEFQDTGNSWITRLTQHGSSSIIAARAWPANMVREPNLVEQLIKSHGLANDLEGAETWLQFYRQNLPSEETQGRSAPYLAVMRLCLSPNMIKRVNMPPIQIMGKERGNAERIYAVRSVARTMALDQVRPDEGFYAFLAGFEATHAASQDEVLQAAKLMVQMQQAAQSNHLGTLSEASYKITFNAIFALTSSLNAGRLQEEDVRPALHYLHTHGCSHLTSGSALWKYLRTESGIIARRTLLRGQLPGELPKSAATLLLDLLNGALRALLYENDVPGAIGVLDAMEDLGLTPSFYTCKRVLLGVINIRAQKGDQSGRSSEAMNDAASDTTVLTSNGSIEPSLAELKDWLKALL